jgi:hypothetical protein
VKPNYSLETTVTGVFPRKSEQSGIQGGGTIQGADSFALIMMA